MIPSNIMEFIGLDYRLDEFIENVVQKPDRTPEEIKVDINNFSKFTRIAVKFKTPTTIVVRRRYKEVTEYVFPIFFLKGPELYYMPRRNCRGGYHFPFDSMQSYELVDVQKGSEFKSFEQFQKKFDPRFISPDYIKNLWLSKSAQHGERYRRDDFRKIGPVGKKVLKEFLYYFKDISEHGPGYTERNGRFILERSHHTDHHLGRDIRISHETGRPCVFYSSEYQGCGNGRYGLLANENEFLWLEDD